MQSRFGGERFTVIGVTDASEAQARDVVEAFEVNYPLLYAAEAERRAYGVRTIWGSVTFLVDPRGEVVARGLAEAEGILAERLAD